MVLISSSRVRKRCKMATNAITSLRLVFIQLNYTKLTWLFTSYAFFGQFGESGGAFYGTKVKTLRRIAASGKTCLLDCSPSAVARIRTAEFMPYVVFLAAPSTNCMKAMYEYGRSMGFTEAWKRVCV